MSKAKTVYDVSLIKIEHLQVHCDETVCIFLCVFFRCCRARKPNFDNDIFIF